MQGSSPSIDGFANTSDVSPPLSSKKYLPYTDQARALMAPPKVELAENLRAALAANAGNWPAMISDIVSLSRGPGALTVSEYFYYRLWDPTLTSEDKKRFIGKSAQQRMHLACNDPRWFAAADDKLLFQSLMQGAGLPVPRLVAVHHPTRRMPHVVSAASATEIASFFRSSAAWPLFIKPIDGMFSLGAYRVEAYSADTDELRFSDGERGKVEHFATDLAENKSGHLIQACLRPHPEIASAIGERLSTVRIFCFLTPEGPHLSRAAWKIPTGANIADNFWRPGNMLGAVDIETGEVMRVVKGVAEDQSINPHHPDTGRALVGMRLPLWKETRELCKAAASLLPGIRTQGWDIALCENGPVLVEVNFGGDFNLAQLASGQGMLDDSYRKHLRACGYRRKI